MSGQGRTEHLRQRDCRGPEAAGTWCSQRALIGHSPYACAAFLLDVNEWLTEYKISLV
jgi:hypothetical protein